MENGVDLKIFFWIGTTFMLFITLSILFVTIIYQKKVYNMRETEAENLLKATMNTEKKERQRIASDLHDSVCGDIGAIRNYVAILNKKEHDAHSKAILEEVTDALNNTLKNVQEISYNLIPPMLETMGLVPTLNDYFERLKKWNNIEVTSNYYSEQINLSSSIVYELYRVVQEFCNNMIKHGSVSQISLTLTNKSNQLLVMLEDNGNSYDFFKCLETSKGMGLKNIVSRTKSMNAELKQHPCTAGNKFEIQLKDVVC
jgi:signal transduction histidine kinase